MQNYNPLRKQINELFDGQIIYPAYPVRQIFFNSKEHKGMTATVILEVCHDHVSFMPWVKKRNIFRVSIFAILFKIPNIQVFQCTEYCLIPLDSGNFDSIFQNETQQ